MGAMSITLAGSYRKLLKRMREVAVWKTVSSVLEWDQSTYMPPGGLAYRADQLASLGGRSHRLFTAKAVGDLLAECEQQGFAADSTEGANLREWRHVLMLRCGPAAHPQMRELMLPVLAEFQQHLPELFDDLKP